MKKIKTPEEIQADKAKKARQHKEWRKNNPEKQQAIWDRFYAKKINQGVEK